MGGARGSGGAVVGRAGEECFSLVRVALLSSPSLSARCWLTSVFSQFDRPSPLPCLSISPFSPILQLHTTQHLPPPYPPSLPLFRLSLSPSRDPSRFVDWGRERELGRNGVGGARRWGGAKQAMKEGIGDVGTHRHSSSFFLFLFFFSDASYTPSPPYTI